MKRTRGQRGQVPAVEPPATDLRSFRRRLLRWYGQRGRALPWRSPTAAPYERVVAEVLLQRTRAETVAAFYGRFFEKFPHWTDLANASTRQLRSFLKPIGLWRRRATSLQKFASGVLQLGGELPPHRGELEKLPAVGQYVASAVLLFYHGRAEPLLDAGMARVIERHFGPRALADIRYDPYLQDLSRRLMRGRRPIDVNWALLDLAALVCKTSKPQCDICPVAQTCRFALERSPRMLGAGSSDLGPASHAASSEGPTPRLADHAAVSSRTEPQVRRGPGRPINSGRSRRR